MDIYQRNFDKIDNVLKDLNICEGEKEAFSLCQRINKKKQAKCELILKALFLCYRNKGGVFINYD